MIYRDDLAYIHHHGFSEFAESAAPGVIAMLRSCLLPAAGHSDAISPDSGATGALACRRVESRFASRRQAGAPVAPPATGDGLSATANASAPPLVVEAGCGSGVLARELTNAGFAVLGFDASAAMLKLARKTAPRARFRRATFDAMRIPPCDAIIGMGEVLNYGTFDGVSKFVTNASRALRTGGVLLFDVAERGSYPAYDERRSGGDDWSVIAIKESDGVKLKRRVLTFRRIAGTIHRDEEVHGLELFDRDELLALLRAHGFRTKIRRSYGTRRLPRGHAVYVAVRR